MKFFFTFFAALVITVVQAQDHAFWVRGGLLHKSIAFESANTIKVPGFYVGMQYQFIHFLTSVNFTMASAEGDSQSSIYVPLCSKFALAEKVYLIGGPALDFSLDSAETENTRFGYTLGGSYELNDHLSIDTHYAMLFSKVSEMRQFTIGVLYQLN
jgi:opacity protein-like surface antigen